jgi:hypothetical protein
MWFIRLPWGLPRGSIRSLSSLLKTSVLILTGLHVRLVRLAGVYGGPEYVVRYRNGDANSYAMIVFEGEVIGGVAKPDGSETLEVRFFSLEEIESLATPAWMSEVLGGVLSGVERAAFRPSTWAPPKAG